MSTTRINRIGVILITFAIVFGASTNPISAADVKNLYEKGFGEKDAAVRAAHNPKKTAAFAGELLESAKLVSEDAGYQAYLFNKAYEIGMLFPEGVPVAVDAMDQFGKAQPALTDLTNANLLTALQKQYQTTPAKDRPSTAAAYVDRALQIADAFAAEGKYDEAIAACNKAKGVLVLTAARHNEVLERLQMLKEEETAAKRIAELKATLKTTPHDAVAAAELVHLLVLDKDAPDQALAYVDATGDAKLKEIVQLAAKNTGGLTDAEALKLGDWYQSQTAKGGKLGNYSAWSRARACYQQFIDTHPRADADHLNAARAMAAADAALVKVPTFLTMRLPAAGPANDSVAKLPVAMKTDPTNTDEGKRIVLFDGSDVSKWRRQGGGPPGFATVNGSLEAREGDIQTVGAFEDFLLHLEFANSNSPPGATGQARSNSGIYLQGRYEIQILDSFGVKNFGRGDCGAIWGQVAPAVNLCRPPGQWQTYDIEFHAATFAGGNKTTPARVTLVWNGEKVLDDVKIDGTTPGGDAEARSPGPIRLQYHGSPVRFRNIWLERIGTATASPVKSPASLAALNSVRSSVAAPETKPVDFALGNGKMIDLLPLIDPVADAVEGNWAIGSDGLRGAGRLRLQYRPPDEYDFILEFTRSPGPKGTPTPLCLACAKGDHAFGLQAGYWGAGNRSAGIQGIHLHPGTASSSDCPAYAAETGKLERAVIQVRRDRIKFKIGDQAVDYPTNYSEVSWTDPNWFTVGHQVLGVGSYGVITFHKLQVVEVTGHGQNLVRLDPHRVGASDGALFAANGRSLSLLKVDPVAIQGPYIPLRTSSPGGSVSAAGQPCDQFIVAPPFSSITYEIPAGAIGFRAIGTRVNAVVADPHPIFFGGIRFRVHVDGNDVYKSNLLTTDDGSINIGALIPPGAKRIELCTTGPQDRRLVLVWAKPEFIFSNAAPPAHTP